MVVENQYSDCVEMTQKSGSIVVDVKDKVVWEKAKDDAAMVGDSSNEAILEMATGIATKAVVGELRKTGAFNPETQTKAVIDSKIPVDI